MSSLWTPSGEHRVPRGGDGGGGDGGGGDGGAAGGGGERPPGDRAADPAGMAYEGEEQLTDEETRARLEELRSQILAAPAEDVIANHAFGLFELAAIHLSAETPALPAARLAIDALGALVEGLGERLGRNAPSLRDGLSQLRMAFVKISQAAPAGDGGTPAAGDDPGATAG